MEKASLVRENAVGMETKETPAHQLSCINIVRDTYLRSPI